MSNEPDKLPDAALVALHDAVDRAAAAIPVRTADQEIRHNVATVLRSLALQIEAGQLNGVSVQWSGGLDVQVGYSRPRPLDYAEFKFKIPQGSEEIEAPLPRGDVGE